MTLPRLGADTVISVTAPGAAPGCGVDPAVVAVAVAPPSVCPNESVPVTNTVTAVRAGKPDTVTRPDCSKLICEASTRPDRVDAEASYVTPATGVNTHATAESDGDPDTLNDTGRGAAGLDPTTSTNTGEVLFCPNATRQNPDVLADT